MNSRWALATPQGTLLVCSEQPGVVTEYDKEGKVVWEFNEFDMVGNGLACRQVLDGKQAGKLRKKLSAL